MTRQQVTLIGIFSLFLAPLLLVLMMRSSWWVYQPGELKNRGLLVQPPVQLPFDSITQEGKWLLLYVMPASCDRKCIDDITSLRQIHKVAGRQARYLAIVILNTNKDDSELQFRIESIYQEFKFVADAPTETLTSLARINAALDAESGRSEGIRTYVVDPMLNVILAYPKDANPNDISKDLKRLATWSRQDNV